MTKPVGGYKHWRQNTVELRLSAWIAPGSVPAAVSGIFVLHLLERATGRDFDDLLLAALLLTGVGTLVARS